MDRAEALHEFWSGFGWKAYDANTVPSSDFDPEMPRITYELAFGELDEPVMMSVSLWARSFSWREVSMKAEEIFFTIGYGGTLVPFDGGAIWLMRGSPFAQRMSDEDDTVRRIYLNIDAEYLVT